MASRRRGAVSLAIGIGVLAMHSLVMLMTPSGAMPMAAAHDMRATVASSMGYTAPASSRLATPPAPCAGHGCIATRGAQSASPATTPSHTGGVVVATPASAGSSRVAANLPGSPRPPPRAGPRSPLCVWRV